MPGVKDEMVVWDEFGGKKGYVNITLTCTSVNILQFSKNQGKKMKTCAACLLSASLDQKMFFF